MAPKRATRSTPVTENPTTTTVTNAQLQAMIDQGVTAALAARDANRNGDDSHTSGTRRPEGGLSDTRYLRMHLLDFMNANTTDFKGTEGVGRITNGLKGWELDVIKEARDLSCEFESKRLSMCQGTTTFQETNTVVYSDCVRMFPDESDKLERALQEYCPDQSETKTGNKMKGYAMWSGGKAINPGMFDLSKVMGKVGSVVTKLEFPEELSRVHNTFHVSNLKKCHADEPLAVPLDGLHLDDKLHFVEEPLEIVGREVKRLKRSRIPLVKVRWNSKRGPEFTWEREDQFKKKYPHLFTKTTPSSSAAS
ncbi:hypothetical protein Tco_0761705 [Tanacetum coccineum]